jgi:hypothetical protein
MTLSLIKTTVNNAQGTYTPSLLVNGYFEINQVGALTINNPNYGSNGQVFVIKTVMDTPNQPILTWGSAYVPGVGMLCGGTGPQGSTWVHAFLYDDDDGKAYLIHSSYY